MRNLNRRPLITPRMRAWGYKLGAIILAGCLLGIVLNGLFELVRFIKHTFLT